MEFMWVIIAISAVIGIIQAISSSVAGPLLQNKFVRMGTLAGKTKAQIISVTGQPNSVSVLPRGKTLLQWMTTGYHIALTFNGEICEGVFHEFANH
jgi:hypothetical protein